MNFMKKLIHNPILPTLVILCLCSISKAQTWTKTSSLQAYQQHKVWGTSSNNVYVSGNGGYIARWNGSTWTEIPVTGVTGQRFALWGSSANDIYSGGSSSNQQAVRYNGTSWAIDAAATTAWASGSIRTLWGTAANNVYMSGGSGTSAARIFRWNGTSWTNQNAGVNNTFSGVAMWGTDANNIWIGGATGTDFTGVIYKWNPVNSTWVAQTGPGFQNIKAMWGTSATNIWAVGGYEVNAGKIYRYNGTTWADVTPSTGVPILYGVWGQDAYNVWVVGYNGTILKWNGTTWTSQTSGTTDPLTSVFVASGSPDVWVTADATTNNILYSNQPYTPLPLNLLSFNAKGQENHIALKWTTVSEVNTDRFDIEVASENLEFKSLGSIPTTGTAVSQSNEYNFDFTKAESGRTYYFRLKMVDKDGSFAQSKMISGRIGSEPATFVFPNPTSDYLELESSEIALINKIDIVDIKGTILVSKAKSFAEKIDVTALANGSYFMKISKKDGSQVSKQFLVQR